MKHVQTPQTFQTEMGHIKRGAQNAPCSRLKYQSKNNDCNYKEADKIYENRDNHDNRVFPQGGSDGRSAGQKLSDPAFRLPDPP